MSSERNYDGEKDLVVVVVVAKYLSGWCAQAVVVGGGSLGFIETLVEEVVAVVVE